MKLTCRGLMSGIFVLFTLVQSDGALAQSTYKCSGPSGVFYSDRPCPADTKTTSMTPTLPQPVPTELAVDLRSEYVAYLGPQCRSLKESIIALESSPTSVRSEWELKRRQLSDALERYRGLCLEQEQRAIRRVYELDQQQRAKQRSEFAAREAEQERHAAEREQCMEMRRIRQTKRQQYEVMSEGERSDFLRFEAAFVARCEGVASTR